MANMFAQLTSRRSAVRLAHVNHFYIELGKNIRRYRQRTGVGLSQEALAKRVGLSRTSITNVEKGRQQLPLHMLYVLADALGVEPVALLPDRKQLAPGKTKVVIDLASLPPDIADFLGRVATPENQ
jgi:transcriptional regulator with XRE-family HTH domain